MTVARTTLDEVPPRFGVAQVTTAAAEGVKSSSEDVLVIITRILGYDPMLSDANLAEGYREMAAENMKIAEEGLAAASDVWPIE